jgi:hypothetical protein
MKTALIFPRQAASVLIPLIFIGFYASGQTITKNTPSVTTGTLCPGFPTSYSVSIPSNFGACLIKWTVTNGSINGDDTKKDVSVTWNDTPGAIATLTVKFSGCENGNPNEGASSTLTETILSIKNQAWDSYGSSVPLDYCNTRNIIISMPHMYVSGTGGIAQPPRIEVQYAWTIPGGWIEHNSGQTGNVTTTSNVIQIDAVGCAKPGNVSVYGTLAPGQFCSLAANSATANISLNGINPVISVAPPPGYTGSTDCNRTPVVFTATATPALGCINSYSWHFPAGWTNITPSGNGNSVTATPSGTDQDAGQVTATANLSCGTQLASGPITISFIQPTLNGGPYVCGGGTPFTFGNVPAGATISWTATPTYLFTTSSGTFTYNGSNGFTLTAQNIYQGGTGASMTATVNSGCSSIPLTKSLYVGLPYANGTANGQQVAFSYHSPYVDPTYTYNMVCSGPLITFNMSVDGATSNDSWQRVSANPTNAYWSILGNNNMEFSFFAPNQTAVFRFSASNGCGTVAKDYYFKSYDCSGGGGGGCLRYAVSPNPTSTTINVMVPNIPPPCGIAPASATMGLTGEEPQNELMIQSITLIDEEGRNKHSQHYIEKTKRVDLDVSELKKGVYIVRVSDGNYIEDHRIIIR